MGYSLTSESEPGITTTRPTSVKKAFSRRPRNRREFAESPFGETVVATGPLAKANPFRFSTKPVEDVTGLVLYEFRPYEAPLGRWLTRDPIGERGFFTLNNEMANSIRRERLKNIDLLNRIALANQIGVADAYLFVGNGPIFSYDYLGLSFGSCWANCVNTWRWDWGAILGIPLTLGTPLGKMEIEKLWIESGVSEQTTWLSRAIGQANRMLMKLPLGNPIRTKLIGALKDLRHAARNPAVVSASTAASILVVAEGFYDIGVMGGCGIACCLDSSAY